MSQLVVDLFINTLQLPRVGHLHHTSILPLVGSSAYSHTTNTLHTAAEGRPTLLPHILYVSLLLFHTLPLFAISLTLPSLFLLDFSIAVNKLLICFFHTVYHSSELKVTIIQMRTPIAKVTCCMHCIYTSMYMHVVLNVGMW